MWQEEKDQIRKCRLSLNLCKLKRILSSNFPKLSIDIKELQELYFSAVDLDSKPEKGERKLADDFIILINESFGDLESLSESQQVQLISLNEYALRLSPYNFDIQMFQANLFDSLGMSVSFSQALTELNLKGVQLESLGYLHVRHTLKHGTFESIFRPTYQRFLKYDESNTYDINKLKLTSLTEENFDQIENFVEYEQYLKKSYFAHLQREVNQQFHILKNGSANGEFFQDLQKFDTSKLTRTSDLKVVLPKYSLAKKQAQHKLPGENVVTFADQIYAVVVEGDDLLAGYKYTRYNNYKANLYNCLLEYENAEYFQ